MTKFTPKYKPNQLICGTGKVAIVTGWTPMKLVADRLKEEEYGVIGQLYSPVRGTSFLIRNLLLNPQINTILMLNATPHDKAGGCQALMDFLEFGVSKGVTDTGKEAWIIKSEVVAYIDKEISYEVLESFRNKIGEDKAVQWHTDLRGLINLVKEHSSLWTSYEYLTHKWQQNENYASIDVPLEFPLVEVLPSVLPGPLYGHRIEAPTIAEAWRKIIYQISSTGTIRPTGYDGNVQELIDLVTVVTDEPRGFYFPEPNYLPVDKQAVADYLPQMLADAPYGDVKYTYGQRMRSWFGLDQVEQVIQKLIKEVDTASAVINLWDSGTGNHLSKDIIANLDCSGVVGQHKKGQLRIPGFATRYGRSPLSSDHDYGGSPCLNHLWFKVTDKKLSMTATFRSNDMFSAWVSNAMGLRALQEHVMDSINSQSALELSLGPLITISQSAHIYDDCWENAKALTRSYLAQERKIDYQDSVGDFLVELEGRQVKISQMFPAGEVAKVYTGTDHLKLLREICAINPAIKPSHAGYLGIELYKASSALIVGGEYRQDK